MTYSIAALFLFAGIGVVNGLLLAIYLLFKPNRRSPDLYFALLLLALCVRIGKSIVVYFDPDTHKTILQIGLSACAFIGPLFTFYVLSYLKDSRQLDRWAGSFLLTLAAALLITGLVFPYSQRPQVWNGPIIKIIYALWTLGVLAGLWLARRRLAFTITHWRTVPAADRHFLWIAVGMIFINATYQFAWFIHGFTYIWGALIFTFFFYYLLLREVRTTKRKSGRRAPASEHDHARLQKLNQLIEQRQLFRDPKLKLDSLAKAADLNRNELSRLLNTAYPNGFAHYLNGFRVEEAKRLIQDRSDLSLEGIGYEAGFNSKSSFFARFKEMTGQTPAQFRYGGETSPPERGRGRGEAGC